MDIKNKWACRNIRELGNWVDVGGRDENPLKSSVGNLIGCLCWEA